MGLISRVSSRTYRRKLQVQEKKNHIATMPPKKDGPSKKNKEKAKVKSMDDKTFGLKNKKGAKQQKFIAQVEKQTFSKTGQQQRAEKQKLTGKAKKQAYLDELNAIMKPMANNKKVILSKKQEQEDKGKEVVYLTIEELVEVERVKLKNSNKKLTPVTLESFLIWKKKKKLEQRIAAEKEASAKKKYAKEGKIVSSTGKELFAYYKDKINMDDDEEADDIDYNALDSDQEEEVAAIKQQGGFREITAEMFHLEGVDASVNAELFGDGEDLDALAAELEALEAAM